MEEDKKIVEEKMKQNVADVEASVKKMEDFTSPTELYRTLVEGVKRYHPSDDLTLIDKAYRVADEARTSWNRELGRKLRITGKGRCNVTNDCSPREFIEAVPGGGRFLQGAIHSQHDPVNFCILLPGKVKLAGVIVHACTTFPNLCPIVYSLFRRL